MREMGKGNFAGFAKGSTHARMSRRFGLGGLGSPEVRVEGFRLLDALGIHRDCEGIAGVPNKGSLAKMTRIVIV